MSLTIDYERLSLALDRPFSIARGTTEERDIVVLRAEDDTGRTGIGAAAPSRYYGEQPGTVEAVLLELKEFLEERDGYRDLATVEADCHALAPRNPSACAAVSIAIHDLVAKQRDVPLFTLFGVGGSVSIASSYTIGIDAPEEMARRARAAVEAGHESIKVKLGGEHDAASIAAVREAVPDVNLRVDANAAWTPKQAVELIEVCADREVAFVEQPVPGDDYSGLAYVHERSVLPIVADESCATLSDVPNVVDRCDIVNIKLMKCGGLQEAIRIVHAARAHHLQVMLGCMVENAISIAAASHLSPLVDYVDLDGALLLADDPFAGSPVRPGDIELADAAGHGVSS